jgi:TolB protein
MIQTFLRLLLITGLTALAPRSLAGPVPITVHGDQEITLALPAVSTPDGDPDGIASTVWNTVHRDLMLTGYFQILDPEGYLEQGGGAEPDSFDFAPWSRIGAATLAKTRILPAASCDAEGGRVCADVFVYYVVQEQKLAGKRFRAQAKDARYLGHSIAGAILEALAGDNGFFRTHLAAVSNRTGNKEIYILGIDGRGVTPVTRNRSINLSPTWSPDGRQVAWTSYKRGNPDLYIKDLVSGRTRVVSDEEGINASAVYSPDGRRIALTRSEKGDADIWILDAKTGAVLQRVTTGGGIDVAPDFSPNGDQLVFCSERSGGSQIYLVDLDGAAPRRLTPTAGFFTDPVFSPDGSRIAFVARDGNFDVLTMKVDGSEMTRLTQDQGDNEDPTWSPNGRYLVFSSTRNGGSDLWISTANGRYQYPLTTSGGWSQPTWSP